MGEEVIILSDENFHREIGNSEIPFLINFWSSWCSPCKRVTLTVEELAREYRGKIKVGKMNVDENPITPRMFGIMNIPGLLLLRDGQVVDKFVGVTPKVALKEHLKMIF